MYDYYNYNTTGYASNYTMLTSSIVIGLAVGILVIVSLWIIFKKAGKPGWASIVPIYNIIVLIQIVGLPLWYLVLLIIPFANIYAIFKIYIELAHKFGKSTGFGVLSVFFSEICLPILAFDKNATKKKKKKKESFDSF